MSADVQFQDNREDLPSKGFRDTLHFSLSFFTPGIGVDITFNSGGEACQTPTLDWRGSRRGPSTGGRAPVGGNIRKLSARTGRRCKKDGIRWVERLSLRLWTVQN